jgi:hypothetical protein
MKKTKLKQIISIFLLFVLSLTSIDCRESVHDNKNRKYYLGKNKLDLQNSDLGDLETVYKYEFLTLELLANDSFYFSMKAPFIRQDKGTWTMESVDNLYTAYLLYEINGKEGFIKDHLIITQGLDLKINTPFGNAIIGKENQKYARYLLFKKM